MQLSNQDAPATTMTGGAVSTTNAPEQPAVAPEQAAQFAAFQAWQASQQQQTATAAPDAPEGTKQEPVKQEPVKQEPASPTTGEAFAYDPTGNAGLDLALDFVGGLGYGDQHPAIIAAQSGDFSQLEVALKDNAQAGKYLALAKEAYQQFSSQRSADAAALRTFAEKAAGGAENWNQVDEWAKATASPEELQSINEAIRAGGLTANAVISFLVQQYNQTNTPNKAPANPVNSNASAAVAASGALTAAEFREATQRLQQANGFRDISAMPEYAALQQRRLQGMRQGR